MIVKCIKCGKEWEKISPFPGITSSFCTKCFMEVITPIVHKRQLREGNFDCFGSAVSYCDQFLCKYKGICIK